MRNQSQKTAYNRIYNYFSERRKSRFSFSRARISAYVKLSGLTAVLLIGVMVTQLQLQAFAKFPTAETIGTVDTIRVYPSTVSFTQWDSYHSVLVPDLDDEALYQDFSADIAAYATPNIVPLTPAPINVGDEQAAEEISSLSATSSSAASEQAAGSSSVPVAASTSAVVMPSDTVVEQDVAPEEVSLLSDDESVDASASVSDETVSSEESGTEDSVEPEQVIDDVTTEPVTFARPTEMLLTFFAEVAKRWPFANATSTLVQTDVATGTNEVVYEQPIADPLVEDDLVASTSQYEVTSTSSDIVATSSDTTTIATTTEIQSGEATSSASIEADSATITLTNFGIDELERGQFIKNVQLRASLAGRYEGATSTIPEVTFVLRTPSTTQTLGSIFIEEEVSNALNGGYFLFGFPLLENIAALRDVTIDVRYEGDFDALENVYLDALWLEIETETITAEDLTARSGIDQLQHLAKPAVHDIVSGTVSFGRHENPVFNLRYRSQRSKVVESVREFLGVKKVKVVEALVVHNGAGGLGIKPDVSVTSDGLISIVIPEEERKKMRPGSYQIELLLDEGGVETYDSFGFQWGVLAINTDQTEYVFGDTAEVTMGALTPNGNTLCNANLRLYVIDPKGRVSLVPVTPSGDCFGNNITDVPDYSSAVALDETGTYELYMERLSDEGSVISGTSMQFTVVRYHDVTLTRNGPTRIFPPAPYPMTFTVTAHNGFTGTLVERVPNSFTVEAPEATISDVDGYYELRWDVSILSGSEKTFSYTFDAPDLSPYLYELGPATLESHTRGARTVTSQTATSSQVQRPQNTSGSNSFTESRQWQIASDATGNMILFWDDGASIPAGWSCLSCGSGTFYQRFAIGSSTYNTTGGSATHTHTADGSVLASAAAATESGSGTIAPVSHTHAYTPTISTESNLPPYRQLRVIQYTASAGEPATLPTGAIAVFDTAVPSGWTRYSAQDGYYIYGEDTPGTTGGSSDDVHDITGTTGVSSGSGTRVRGGGSQAAGASDTHTHDVNASTTATSKEPPYIEVILGKLDSAAAPVNGIISMWTDEVPSGWLDVSSSGGDPFHDRFLKASTSYGTTGGSRTHTPADVIGIVSSGPSATISGRTGTAGSGGSHTHNVSVTDFSEVNHMPPFVTAVFGKRQGTDPVYEQLSYRWYANTDNQTPTDAWPTGVLDLAEGAPVTATSTPVKDGEVIRLRVNAVVSNATSTAGETFTLQYAAANTCSAASGWETVGDTASSTLWRGYNNSGVTDDSTLSSTTLASTTVAETYQENGTATGTPNQIDVAEVGEWDFVLQHNGAAAGTNYCFRLISGDGTPFATYTQYPQVFTNEAPPAPTLNTLFDNEKASSTDPLFTFVTTDVEGDAVHYQVQIDDDYDFTSTLEDRDTISNATQFENLVVAADKAPFITGQIIQFDPASTMVNGTTYWWRVRAEDPDGSNAWGDWSEPHSFTIDTTVAASAWFQTTEEQFNNATLVGVESLATDEVDLITGSTTGTITSPAIAFAAGTAGTAWGSLRFSDTETSGDIVYTIQYLSDASLWEDIPDSDLPGNSSGHDTSPVNLLDLEVSTYHTIRVVGTLSDSGGSPSLQDWSVHWGYRVETPSITKLFPNEKVGTTTPIFEFATTDPQSDDLTYQISWSTDSTFTSSTTRTSDVDAGFVNIETGIDTDPFNSGERVQFEIQGVDVLTNNTTYWWRVRAKDTTGDDAYSFWTEPQSFTVDTTVVVSTWFQTTEEQFETDILSGTLALTSDEVAVATTAREALIVYGEGTESDPRYRQWDGSTWSAEGTLEDVGAPVVWSRVEAGTTREEYVAVTVGTDADINAQVFSLGAWGSLQEMTTSVSNINAQGFDVAYETLSGDAMVAFCDGDADPSYYTWDGSTWTSGGTINVAETSNCEWIALASDPVSNEIIVLVRGVDGNPYEAQVWNGLAWGNSTTLGRITETAHAGMAIAYEESGGQAVIVASDGPPARFTYNTWNGSTWGTAATQGLGDDFEWGTLVADDGSDELALCYQDEDTNIGMVRWTGSAWAGQTELLTTTGKAKTDPGFACVFESAGSRDNYIMTAYTDTTQTNYSFWDNSTWSTGAQINSIGDTITAQLERTGVGAVLGVFFDETNDSLLFSHWDGTAWATTTTLEDDMSVDTTPYGRPYSIGIRNDSKEGTTIVSPGINFTDGIGPYWEEMSWVDTTPGASDILYSVQYYDGSSWEFISDSDLPGNSSGTSTSPIDLSGLNKNTYNLIRPYAALSCDGSNNCPTLQDWTVQWAEGITISGTAQEYDQLTNVTAGTVAVAVNGVLQTGKTAAITGGAWSINNVTVFPGDIVTVFVTGAADVNEAVGVTRYDGLDDITGFQLYERHVALGSDDATTTPLTNADIGLYDVTNTEDVFFGVTGSLFDACATTGCADVELFVNASTTYQPGGTIVTHDIENNGTVTATSSIYVSGSWDNNATTSLASSVTYFTATSTVETIDSAGAAQAAFGAVTFGTTTGSATWDLLSPLDVDGDLTVDRGTLDRDSILITVAGDLTTGANGFWVGVATTTFDGANAAVWSDQNSVLQNVGAVAINGDNKIVTLGSDVLAESVFIGADDTLDASVSHYDITVLTDWNNTNAFVARNGTVYFVATSSGQVIIDGGDAFYDVVFNGVSGDWSFANATLDINNNLTIATGTVTLPTATTTIGGSFSSATGTFAHNNAAVVFDGSGTHTITTVGDTFTNAFYNLRFDGSGTWTFTDAYATTSGSVSIQSGTVVLPSVQLAVGGSFNTVGGAFTATAGSLTMFSSGVETISLLTSALYDLTITGSGTFTMTDTNATVAGDVSVQAGTLVLPTGTLSVGGSWSNTATVSALTGTVRFNSAGTGETIDLGSSALSTVAFDSVTGGWNIIADATTTASTSLVAGTVTLDPGQSLAVGGAFTNQIGGASTTWTGSTLYLVSGTYAVNAKTDVGDQYATLSLGNTADISWWSSSADTVQVATGGSLYSQDHAGIDGDLYIYGDYERLGGNEYWSYANDFDGTSLGTSSRQVNVRLADGSTVTLDAATFTVLGDAAASTTIANQGAGTYTLTISGGTTTMNYYEYIDLGTTGITLSGSGVYPSLNDGLFTVAAAAGSVLTISSTTIDANPALQIERVTFATTTAISATNVTQNDGTPTSYWWFRNSAGNLDGEVYDNDTGDPGSVRWDDSSLIVTLSGVVYSDAGTTPLTGGTCDGVTNVVRVVVAGGSTYNGTCSNVDGSYSIGGVTIVGDPTITVYLNDASGGEQASVVTKTVTADVADLDLYANRVIVRHEDVSALAIADMAAYDSTDDDDVRFTAATSTIDSLTTLSPTELFVWASSTFTPGGSVALHANGTATTYDGSLYLAPGSTFVGSGTTTYTIGGIFTQGAGATFTPASSTVVFNATTTGKAITAHTGESIAFNMVTFTGVGGGWNINGDVIVTDDIHVATGTVTGTADITLQTGSFYGNGLVSLGGGTTTINQSNTLGGTQAWTFYDLILGSGSVVGTTTPATTATTTIANQLTIANAHFFDLGSSVLELAGDGTVLVETGTLLEDTSTIVYSGTAATNIESTNYYNLHLNAAGGNPTYTATGIGVQVSNDLQIGGVSTTTVDFATNDPVLDIGGNFTIRSNGTFIASDSGSFTVAGDYHNDGTFTASGGSITFDGAGTQTIAAGNSPFSTAVLSGTGAYTVTESATSTSDFTIGGTLSSFALTSAESLAVGGVFSNALGGAATTWSDTTIHVYGGATYTINASTTSDVYSTIQVGTGTHVGMWNSVASTTVTQDGGSLYSMDHASVDGDLYIYGDYLNVDGTDYWSYATDFDGTDLSGGNERVAAVYVSADSSILYQTDGALSVLGAAGASTTVANQGSGTFSFSIGDGGSTTMQYYDYQDLTSTGLTFSGAPTVADLSYGSFLVANNTETAMTVGGTAINANPALTFTNNHFATSSGVTTAVNVTATGTAVSSWRFTNHSGVLAGEAFDSDPDGDPGYVVWDDSAASITIGGVVYGDEGSTVSGVCDGSTNNVHVRVAGLTSYTTSCNATTGVYAVSSVTYSPGDSLVVYIDGESVMAAAVTEDPISSINNLDVYEDRVIVRHEGADAMSIADMAIWDSSDDADIPFTAVTGSPDSLTLPADTKLIVWNDKTFTPEGTVTVSGGGAGAAFDGSVQLYSDATWNATGAEEYSVGGSFVLDDGAVFNAAQSTTTFTTTGAGRTIDVNENDFYNLRFTGSGSWNITDATLQANDIRITAGAVTLPTGTTTVRGSYEVVGGSFTNNGSPLVLTATTTGNVVAGNGSDFAAIYFTGSGAWVLTDTHATATASIIVTAGSVTLPSGTLTTGGSFRNEGGSITHNNAVLTFTNNSTSTLLAGGSDMGGARFTSTGPYVIEDGSIAFTGDVRIEAGSLTMATNTTAVGGSLMVSGGGSFDHASGTVLFNASTVGETVSVGGSDFYNVVFNNASGGWTITGDATTTRNFSLLAANDFTLQSGAVLAVENVFTNSVGGTATTWLGSTLVLGDAVQYAVNTKIDSGDQYDALQIGSNTDITWWHSAATTTTVATDSSLYSQDHAAVDGSLYIYGDYHIGTTSAYWSYATDFDGTDLSGGSERVVTVALAANATTTLAGGSLEIIGVAGNETAITNQGSGTYAIVVSGGAFNAQRYSLRNASAAGLQFSGTPVITALDYGDFELAVGGGTLITLASSTLNANASMVITGMRFATATAITGNNVTLLGVTANAWTFTSHTGNLDGEDYDVDGATQCGSIRWSDSSCLLTQQTHYRWRNDDGGVGAPDSTWFNSDWDKRQSVRVINADATAYTDAVVQLTVAYDADMQADFDDLRFTDRSGTTTVSHFIASTTDSIAAEVWVKVPSLPADDAVNLYMYYGNASASSTASSTTTFVVADDFEDGNISEYSGDTSLFAVDGSFAYGGTYGLDNTSNESARATDGIFDTSKTVSQGEIIRYQQYVDTTAGTNDEVCTLFAVQSPGTNNTNYAVCLEQFGTDRVSLVRDVTDTDASGTILASTTATYVTGWHTVEIDWQSGGDMDVTVTRDSTTVASLSANDTTYSSGGIGFTYWFHNGGWDNYTSRPRVDTEPLVQFGGEQVDGGATWAAELNTVATEFTPGEIARLRVLVDNTGLAITDQTYQLEYAYRDAAPSCEAVTNASYAAVPVQSSCGTSPVCMQTSGNVTDGEAIADLLTASDSVFVTGETTEDPANTADAITIAQDAYTELEYVITPTVNVSDPNMCFRVTDSGATLDTYLSVAALEVRFDPSLGGVTLNGGDDVYLVGGTTTRVYATSTVTDLNGSGDLAAATTTFYHSDATAACTADPNDCYIATTTSQCSFTSCAGNSCVIECYADFLYFASSTDTDGGAFWYAFMEVEDNQGGTDFDTSIGQDVVTLAALEVQNDITYIALQASSTSGANNASTSVENIGNISVNVDITGTDMTDGGGSSIAAAEQKYATTTFNYDACVTCNNLATSAPLTLDLDLSKPTSVSTAVTDEVYWGIRVPFGTASSPHSGTNTFTVVAE